MRGWIFLFIGLLTVAGIVYKIINCAACADKFLGFDMSGYTYLAIQTFFAFILFNAANRDLRKTKNTGV